jgi:hypothetical protein
MSIQTTPILEAFNAGEFGGRMAARVQFDKYQNAGAVYQNVLPLPQGGWTRRSGFRYINSAKSASARPWLIPFIFSTTQAYVLELGNNALRFFRNQGLIFAPDITAAITNGTFDSGITGWTDNSTGTGSLSYDATNDRMNLNGGGSGNEAIATQAITITETTTTHVLRFQVVGDAGDEITVRVGTASGGASEDIYTSAKRLVGWHTIEIDPDSNATIYLSFENSQNKTVQIDNIELLDDAAVEITTPWSESELPSISYAQSADVIYFAIGGSTRVYKLLRYGNASWSLEVILFEDGPYLAENTTSTTLTLGAATGNGVTLTASATTGINDGAGFRATDVGRLFRFKNGSNNWGWGQIVGFTSTTVVTVDIKATVTTATATTNWRLGEWNYTDGWPAVVSFVQQRFVTARTNLNPQKFWMSKSAEIQNFADEDNTGAVLDDSSIVYKFAARQVNTIRWITSRKKPIIGTQGGEWTLRSDGAVLTPTDIAADFEVSGGVAALPPLEIRSRLVFAQAQARKLVEFADVIQENGIQGFDSFDLTLLNDRVLQGGAQQLTYAQEPDSVIWTVREDGQMPTLTYQPEQSVIGWARQIVGGTFEGGDTVVESVTAIPGQNGSEQFKDSSSRFEVWVAVKRTINGATTRYIECLEKQYNGAEDLQEEAFYVDSGLSLDVPVTISGATKAKPVVITATAHGFSDGDEVRIVRVKGMTQLNAQSFKIFEVLTNTFELAQDTGANVTNITQANPGVATAPAHGLSTGDEIAFFGVNGMTNVNGNGYTVTKIDDNSFSIGVDTSGFSAYTSAGTAHLAIDGSAYSTYTTGGEVRKKVSSVSGLSHLEGETVKVFADGAVQTDKTVASGAITLDDAASVVHVGLGYEHRWKSLKLAYGSQNGSAIGKPKSIADIILVLMEAAEGSISVATVDSDGEGVFSELDLRDATNLDGDAVPFFTGEVRLGVTAGYDQDIRIVLKGSEPVPVTMLGILPEMDTSQ